MIKITNIHGELPWVLRVLPALCVVTINCENNPRIVILCIIFTALLLKLFNCIIIISIILMRKWRHRSNHFHTLPPPPSPPATPSSKSGSGRAGLAQMLQAKLGFVYTFRLELLAWLVVLVLPWFIWGFYKFLVSPEACFPYTFTCLIYKLTSPRRWGLSL